MSKVTFSNSKIYLNNKPVTLLCSSLFYFRIPEDLWEDRIIKIKNLGYNCLDVYFPWNFHETSEDSWDFTGIRNIKKFLDLTIKHNMFIIARPGPYICSEWDLGAMPSYLLTKEDIVLRDNNPIFLSYVNKWFNKILPLIKDYLYTNNGNILMVQLENELDFYHCKDRHGYISSLKEMALSHNIDVPLIACAGQGDITGATGLVHEVYPAMNFYPDSYEPNFTYIVSNYISILSENNIPLLVTETNRQSFFLKRLLGVGVKLIGPYNQVGGTDFDFTNSINNWGKPLAFMTSNYDFGSLVKPSGEYSSDYKDAFVLKGLLTTFNENIGDSNLVFEHNFSLHTDNSKISPITVLRNSKNEQFLTVANCGDDASIAKLNISNDDILSEDCISLAAKQCKMIVYNINLEPYNFSGKIHYSSSEILNIKNEFNKLYINTFTQNKGKLIIKTTAAIKSASNTSVCSFNNNLLTIELTEACTKIEVLLDDNSLIIIDNINYDNILDLSLDNSLHNTNFELSLADYSTNNRTNLGLCKNSLMLEDNNIFTGYAIYDDYFDLYYLNNEACNHILLEEASDVLSLYVNNEYEGTYTPGGQDILITTKNKFTSSLNISIKTEIWGHSNFDDIALPCTGLSSKKGIKNLSYITQIEDISHNWNLVQVGTEKKSFPIYSSLGGFLSTIMPFYGVYEKELVINTKHNSHYLKLYDSDIEGRVYINDVFVGDICSLNSTLNISSYLNDSTSTKLKIEVIKKTHRFSNGTLKLLSGYSSNNISLSKVDKDNLLKNINSVIDYKKTALPIALANGKDYILKIDIKDVTKDLYIDVKGSNIKLTAIVDNIIASRIFISNNDCHPSMRGGHNDKIFIPKSWLHNANSSFYIYIEAINFEEAILESIDIKAI